MTFPWSPNRDSGEISPRIFLSASVPKLEREQRFLSGPSEPRLMARVIETRMRDAVTSLVAELLRRGGQLAFGGHPAITPMVASVARRFTVEDEHARPVLLYQSEKFRHAEPPAGRAEMEAQGLAEVVWVPTDRDGVARRLEERGKSVPASLLQESTFDELKLGQAAATASAEWAEALTCMRIFIFGDSRPGCTVCMGGMEGIEGEYKIYRAYLRQENVSAERRIFALRSTYGAAAALDRADINFYDAEFFTGAAREEAGLLPDTLEVYPDKAVIETQLLRRVRYERLIQQLVEEIAALGPLR